MSHAKRQIRAVVFDLDDTLYAERDYVRSGYHAVARHLRTSLRCEKPFEQWLWERFLGGESARAFDALNEHFDLALDENAIAGLVTVYREHRPRIEPHRGVRELLDRLSGQCRLALLSDGFLPAQQLKLEALGLEGCFEAVVFTEELGPDARKPSTRGFEEIRRLLGVPHESCAYVADNPAKDFVGPNRLGWLSVHLLLPGQVHSGKSPSPEGAPGAVIRSLDELPSLLESGGAG